MTGFSGILDTVQSLVNVGFSLLLTFLGKAIVAGIILLVGFWLKKMLCAFLKKVLEKSKVDMASGGFLISIANVLAWIAIILTAVSQIFEITALVAALGAAGLTASFALQGSLGNFISGVQVIFSKPFSVGNFISVGEHSGTVKEITVLYTTLTTIDNKEIIIPNSSITSGALTNFSAQETRRLDLSYSVSYDTDLQKAKDVIDGVISKDERILHEQEKLIAIGKHMDSAVEIIVRVWVPGAEYFPVYFSMQENIKKAFDENQISIPFPQLDVHNVK